MNVIFFSRREGRARQFDLAHPVTLGLVAALALGILGTAFPLGLQLCSGHTRTLDILLQDTRMVRGAVNDMAKETVTAGEVEAIHHDLNRLQQQVSELTARLEIVEGRDRH